MTESTTHSHPAELYIRVLGGNEQARRALLACSAALQWDDEAARAAVALVAGSNGSTGTLVEEIKGLACVWHRWDGSWYLSDEVRTYLHERLEAEIDTPTRQRLYEVLTAHADRRLGEISPDGPLATYRVRARRIESAYPRLLDPDRAEEGGRLLGRVWSESRGQARIATCEAVAHLVPELSRRARRLPNEVLFLRGRAAYQKGEWKRAEADFKVVYENGRPGEIYATAAHLYGNLEKDRRVAEQALRHAIQWSPQPYYQAWHSLGNLLSKERRRWSEAEKAYLKSLELSSLPEDQGQVWHSLGNLLSKDRHRWSEAEEAYRKSLELDLSPEGKGQVWHSLGNLLCEDRRRWSEAKEAYRKSLELLQSPEDKGQVWHSLGNLLSKDDRRWSEAEEAYRKSLELLQIPEDKGQVWHSLGNLLSKDRRRWSEAEEAYRRGLELLQIPEDKGQVWHSLGNLLSKDRRRWPEAEDAYRKSLELLQIPEDKGQVWHSLGNLLSEERRWPEVEEAYRKSLDLNRRPEHQSQVHATWADRLMKLNDPGVYDQAEEHALKAQRLDLHGLRTRGLTSRVLANLYEARGEWEKAIAALEVLRQTNRLLRIPGHEERLQQKIDRLRLRSKSSA